MIVQPKIFGKKKAQKFQELFVQELWVHIENDNIKYIIGELYK